MELAPKSFTEITSIPWSSNLLIIFFGMRFWNLSFRNINSWKGSWFMGACTLAGNTLRMVTLAAMVNLFFLVTSPLSFDKLD